MKLIVHPSLRAAVVVILSILTNVCSCRTATPSIETTAGYTLATVIKYPVDGCSYLLQLENGKKLEPENLQARYKKNNLKVWVKYRYYQGNSSCMAGEMVTITHIITKK